MKKGREKRKKEGIFIYTLPVLLLRRILIYILLSATTETTQSYYLD